jgi:hypothetical protein
MNEQVINLPGGVDWIVQAWRMPPEAAKAEFERIQSESAGKKQNFSIWRTMYPHDQSFHMIVLCARRENLPVVQGATPVELDRENAIRFALRRARTGLDGMKQDGLGVTNEAVDHIEQLMRYGEDSPVLIDPATGGVVPYKPPAGGS